MSTVFAKRRDGDMALRAKNKANAVAAVRPPLPLGKFGVGPRAWPVPAALLKGCVIAVLRIWNGNGIFLLGLTVPKPPAPRAKNALVRLPSDGARGGLKLRSLRITREDGVRV